MHPGGGNTAGFFETGRLATRGGPSGDTTETTMPTMKTTLALPAATCDAAFLLGGCQHTHSHQDLNGAWRGTGHTINSAGRSETNKYLDLEVDENGLIEGVAGWRLLEGAGGHDQKHRRNQVGQHSQGHPNTMNGNLLSFPVTDCKKKD